ncbi:MAG: hypothetical protein COB61_004755 [Thiotrichales bacterium]|nr:hypothetical protein [Thiotrichales bacterium]
MKIKRIVFTVFFMLISGLAYSDEMKSERPTAFSALSAWTNQEGSTLYIDTVGSNGLITGTYINRASDYSCRNISYPVTGWVYGTAITFNTVWESTTESCNSITAWTGFYYKGQISTLWQLTINGSTSTSQILTGSDVFMPASSVLKKSLIRNK